MLVFLVQGVAPDSLESGAINDGLVFTIPVLEPGIAMVLRETGLLPDFSKPP